MSEDSETRSEREYEFKKMLKKLSKFSGVGTQLISTYIPVGSPIHDTTNKLREEVNQASNIKSKSTRLNVVGALERIIQNLKQYKKTPKNGVGVFCGNVSDNPAKVDIELFAVEPLEPLRVGAYRCDNRFFLDPFKRMIEHAGQAYGIVVVGGRETTLAMIKGTETKIITKINSTAHQKVRKGGQSSARYQRLIEESIEFYYTRIGEHMDKAFLGKVKGVIIAGPGPTKEFFLKQKSFNYQIKVLGIVDTGYTDEYGVREAVEKAKDIMKNAQITDEKNAFQKFMKQLIDDEDLAAFGKDAVLSSIKDKQAKLVLISEKAEDIDSTLDLAREVGVKIMVLSTNTNEGIQLLEGFDGYVALLKYKKYY